MALTGTQVGPADIAATVAAVEAALWAADMGKAMRLSEEAVGAGANHPTLLGLAGLQRMHLGDNHNALPLLERARQQTPQHVDLLFALGECLVRLGRPREALEPFDTALSIAPDARLHFGRAMALEDLSELDAARAGFEQVLTLDPAQSEALSRLALLAVQRGDIQEARTLAERALAIDSKNSAARIALAAAALEQKDIATAEMAVSALVQDRTLGPVNRTFAFSLAGDILDAQDRTAEAFSAYAASKAIQRDAFLPSMEGVERVLARETRLTHYFRQTGHWPSAPPPQAGPQTHVFLVGFPRSGTTLLEQVLASHPDVATMEERPCLIDSAKAFFGANADLDRLAALSDAELQPWRDLYWKRVAETEPALTKRVFLDKLPLNAVFLPLIARLFPKAKILLALRDPRDVVLSCFRRRFAMNAGMFEFTELENTAIYYDSVMKLIEVYRGKLALDVAEARHESLVADFDSEAAKLCAFLGLGFNDAMRAFASRARAKNIDTPSNAQVARGLSTAGVAQWRRYAPQLEPVLPVLAPFVARFGYPEN
ncbi:MAG: sulfotransferase [Alphaproteobacteria bacterium]|nr:sulfotransferase [Alphaproteobacteria bacterium]